MAKTACRLEPVATHLLHPLRTDCPACGRPLWADYSNRRTLANPGDRMRLVLTIRRYHNPTCATHRRPYRPEAEGRLALPHHEFGLDVVALVGQLRANRPAGGCQTSRRLHASATGTQRLAHSPSSLRTSHGNHPCRRSMKTAPSTTPST